MNLRKSALLPLVTMSLAVGCGGGGGSHDNGGNNGGVVTVEKATTSLNAALESATPTSLSKAATDFNAAYLKSPSGQTAIGYGVSQAAVSAQSLATLFGASLSRGSARTTNPLVSSLDRLKPLTGLIAQIGGKDRLSLGALLPGFTIPRVPKGRAYPQSPTPAEVRTALATAATQLDVVLTRLADDATVDSLETAPLTVVSDGETVKLGKVEGYGFRSAVKVLRGLIDAALAYNVDYGTYDSNANFRTKFADRLATDGATILATEYLPGGTFGTLAEGGKARLADLKLQWTGVADDGIKAVDTYRSRTKGQKWLTDLAEDQPTEATLAEAVGALTNFKTGLNNPISTSIGFDETKTPVVINVGAFLSNPPADLRAFFPDLTVTLTSGEDFPTFATLTPKTDSIEDRTFGGLIGAPGVPAELLYNADRQFYLSPEDDSATQGDVALFAFNFFTDASIPSL